MIEQGAQFNDLTFVGELPERSRGSVVGMWKCVCGAEKRAVISTVRSGHLKSCGCRRRKHSFASRSAGRSWHVKGLTFTSSREAAAHFKVDHKTVRRWAAIGEGGSHAVPRY